MSAWSLIVAEPTKWRRDVFGRKKKEITALQARFRNSIVQEALTLIAVANKAETEGLRSCENTDVRELFRAAGVFEAQRTLTERIVSSRSSDLTIKEISDELIRPVLERSVVGEVAQLALEQALHRAQETLEVS